MPPGRKPAAARLSPGRTERDLHGERTGSSLSDADEFLHIKTGTTAPCHAFWPPARRQPRASRGRPGGMMDRKPALDGLSAPSRSCAVHPRRARGVSPRAGASRPRSRPFAGLEAAHPTARRSRAAKRDPAQMAALTAQAGSTRRGACRCASSMARRLAPASAATGGYGLAKVAHFAAP